MSHFARGGGNMRDTALSIAHRQHPVAAGHGSVAVSSEHGPRTGRLVALVASATLACAGFAALGAWQVQRLAWKQALIARVDAHLGAAPVDAPGPDRWGTLSRASDEYLRVRLRGHWVADAATPVRALTELG